MQDDSIEQGDDPGVEPLADEAPDDPGLEDLRSEPHDPDDRLA